jgi:HEAT repeat protein
MLELRSPLRTRPRAWSTSLFALVLATLGGCASTPDEVDANDPFRPLGPASRADDNIGKYLADLNTSITAWHGMAMTASTAKAQHKHHLLEINISERAVNRFSELLQELEAGPERNRVIAAAAIGFARDTTALSPLLAALNDPEDRVVNNALMSLGMLETKETPLFDIGDLLRYSPNPRIRWSAANAALELIGVGANSDGILEAARAGLTDAEEPIVRSQCAAIVALINDTDSIKALGALMFDDVPLVSRAAADATSYLGRHNARHMTAAATALYTALAEGDRELKLRVHPALVSLAKRNYDLDIELWEEWLQRLP